MNLLKNEEMGEDKQECDLLRWDNSGGTRQWRDILTFTRVE